MSTPDRKVEHLEICLSKPVESRVSAGFEHVHLVHRCLPEMDIEDVDTRVRFLGKELSAPIIVTGMTGGHGLAEKFNAVIAEVVEELGLGMGVGSQRAALEDPSLERTFSVVRERAPTALVIANLGAPQIASQYGVEDVERAIEMVGADAIAIHLNPLQEVLQPEGKAKYSGVLDSLRTLVREVEVPLIAKETGAGVSMEDAERLRNVGIRYIDVAGLGGTSWAAVEMYRCFSKGLRLRGDVAASFWDWGIPTVISIVEVKYAAPDVEVIASGGVRSGLHAAKALALGASVVGLALPVLKAAARGKEELRRFLEKVILELKVAMFLAGCRRVEELKSASIVITGFVREWLDIRGINVRRLCRINRSRYEVLRE